MHFKMDLKGAYLRLLSYKHANSNEKVAGDFYRIHENKEHD